MANMKRTKAQQDQEYSYEALKDFWFNAIMDDGAYCCPLSLSTTEDRNANSGIFGIREVVRKIAAYAATRANKRGTDEEIVIDAKDLLQQMEEEDPDAKLLFIIRRKNPLHPYVQKKKEESPLLTKYLKRIQTEDEEEKNKQEKIMEEKQKLESLSLNSDDSSEPLPF